MSDDKKFSFTVKAVINKQKTRVLYAEIDNDFADILLRFSTMSLGLAMRALLKHFGDKTPVIGRLNHLYEGFQKHSIDCDLELYNYDTLKKYNRFQSFPSDNVKDKCYVSEEDYFDFLKIFPQNTSFIIREDLRIVANEKGSILESLNNVGVAVKDVDGAHIKIVTIGVNEIMDFLLSLFISRRPLTDIILGTAVNLELAKIKPESGIPLHHPKKDSTCNNTVMFLKIMFQKSTNKLLFAESNPDFVNYLFSVLLIPLGRVQYHLGSFTFLKNVDSLCTSVSDLASRYIYTEAKNFPFAPLFQYDKFIITDDLSVTRYSFVYGLSLLDELKISSSDVKELQYRIGIDEVFSILRASLTSTRALTDGLINPRLKKRVTPKLEN